MMNCITPSSAERDVKLQLKSRRLNEKQCQVHFQATAGKSHPVTGHMLVDAKISLREVAAAIRERIFQMQFHKAQPIGALCQLPQFGGGYIFFEA